MSKTNPGSAIFLTEDLETVANKIKVAETVVEGIMNEKAENFILIAKGLTKSQSERDEIDALSRHAGAVNQ